MTMYSTGQQASCSKTITETDFVLFAGLSGDFNPIHIDHEYAKQTRFNQRIAHGLLTSSLLSQLLGIHLPGKGSVYMEQTIKFTAPVFIGDTIEIAADIPPAVNKSGTAPLNRFLCSSTNQSFTLFFGSV